MSRKRLRELSDEMKSMESSSWDDLWAVAKECSTILNEIAPVKRRPFLSKILEDLYEQQNGICALCSEPIYISQVHVDHRIPIVRGGGNEYGNLQLAHPSCNQRKGDKVKPHDLIPYLEDKYMNLY